MPRVKIVFDRDHNQFVMCDHQIPDEALAARFDAAPDNIKVLEIPNSKYRYAHRLQKRVTALQEYLEEGYNMAKPDRVIRYD